MDHKSILTELKNLRKIKREKKNVALPEELTKIYTCVIPEEPDTNKVHQQIRHCRNNQVMPTY